MLSHMIRFGLEISTKKIDKISMYYGIYAIEKIDKSCLNEFGHIGPKQSVFPHLFERKVLRFIMNIPLSNVN